MQPLSPGAANGQIYGMVIGLVVVVGLLFLRNRRPQPLRIERLWIRPLLFIVIAAVTLIGAPPPLTALNLALLGIGLAAGAAFGWQRGRFMRIEVDPDTHAVTSRVSPIGLIFILPLLAVRMGLRGALAGSAPVPAIAVADALIVMAAALMVAQGLEMWLRARRLLAAAQSVGAPVAR